MQLDFASDAPGACPQPAEGTGARSVFKDFPKDLYYIHWNIDYSALGQK